MSVHSTTVSGTAFIATEFWDLLCARYTVSSLKIHSHCNGCGTAFGVTHALILSTDSLVIARHKKICDRLLYLYQQAFTPVSVHTEPLIHQGRIRSEKEISQGSDKDKEIRGYVMIQDLWD